MIRYCITLNEPEKHYLDISVKIETLGIEMLMVQLPSWRPGRYELANFAQNIRKWKVYDGSNNELKSHKTNKDTWSIETNGSKEVTIQYDYYSNVLDAGNTFFDENQLYVNPVNCLLYMQEHINEPCEIQLINLPQTYKLAGSLLFDDERKALAKDYHTLADSPFMVCPDLINYSYDVGEYHFDISLVGNAKPDWERIHRDFTAFSSKQISLFGELPVKDYHFLFQMPDFKYYHGVEHLASNVICIGPAENLSHDDFYNDFLGISSHELFHSWNVKSIRPKEMFPYDYSKENYTVLNYVTEGVTSYYGDFTLLRSGVYSSEVFFAKVSKTIERHENNFGNRYQTLVEASMDSWLDGYKMGVPERKISFYQKGMIVALVLDLNIRRDTDNVHSLDTVMKILYDEFAKKNKGYSEADYLEIVSTVAGKSYRPFFEKYIWGLDEMGTVLSETLDYIGCKMVTVPSPLRFEDRLGFRLLEAEPSNKNMISHIAPGSPADVAKLILNDKIIAINGKAIDMDINEVIKEAGAEDIEFTFIRKSKIHTVVLNEGAERYYPLYQIVKNLNATESQKQNFSLWAQQEF